LFSALTKASAVHVCHSPRGDSKYSLTVREISLRWVKIATESHGIFASDSEAWNGFKILVLFLKIIQSYSKLLYFHRMCYWIWVTSYRNPWHIWLSTFTVKFLRRTFFPHLTRTNYTKEYGATVKRSWVNMEKVSSTMMKLLNDRF